MKFAMAQDLITKNPCDYCKPPKLQRKAVNALTREERTRMMRLARAAEPSPLVLAIEIALTTGMRRGEKIQDAFDVEESPAFCREAQGEPEFPFTVEQLESLLAYAKGLGAPHA